MSMPMMRPKRKNPILRTRVMNLPPSARGRVALGLTAGAAEGRLMLQVCERCASLQYPPREACAGCLSPELRWREQSGEGDLLAVTILRHSNDLYFRERLPWRIGMVKLDAGPTLIVHLHGDVAEAPCRVRVGARLDRSGQAVLIGFPEQETPHMADDPVLRDMTSDPKFRKVLITDGKSPVGQAVARAMVKAGADIVWVGVAEPW
ncbi:MAG: short-chain dehydrogenase, partial [Betaproteobacteria bacterium]|nr:short-chain dehydrogenase [Betaproteobacteria bacterium]